MDSRSSRASRNTTVPDTIAVLGLCCLFYLMFASVATNREPDWPLFWLAALALVIGVFFYGPCVRAILDLIDDYRSHHPEKRLHTGPD